MHVNNGVNNNNFRQSANLSKPENSDMLQLEADKVATINPNRSINSELSPRASIIVKRVARPLPQIPQNKQVIIQAPATVQRRPLPTPPIKSVSQNTEPLRPKPVFVKTKLPPLVKKEQPQGPQLSKTEAFLEWGYMNLKEHSEKYLDKRERSELIDPEILETEIQLFNETTK